MQHRIEHATVNENNRPWTRDTITARSESGVKVRVEDHDYGHLIITANAEVHLTKPKAMVWVGFPEGAQYQGIWIFGDGRHKLQPKGKSVAAVECAESVRARLEQTLVNGAPE